jgi:hypothetical protein
METIPQVAEAMKDVMTSQADELARATGFVQRQRKLSGSTFAQMLVFGWLHNPEATLEELAQQATAQAVGISAQAVAARFSIRAADFVRSLLNQAVPRVIGSKAVLVPLLYRFRGVYLQASTVLSLPASLHEQWPAQRTNQGQMRAALKVQVRFDCNGGAIEQLHLQAQRQQDRAAAQQQAPLPAGSLRLADLGYFSLPPLRYLAESGVYFLTRIRAGTCLLNADGVAYNLVELLTRFASQGVLDRVVYLGKNEQLPCRLLAWRVPPAVAEQRRQRIRESARKQQRPAKAQTLALAEWTYVAANVPQTLLTPAAAECLLRVRWQIELLFKLWKSHGHLDHSRSANPERILTEIYAKLLALLIQHWILMATCWSFPDRSLTKALYTMRKFVQHIADHINHTALLCVTWQRSHRCLLHGCRTTKRRTKPSTSQLLLQFA